MAITTDLLLNHTVLLLTAAEVRAEEVAEVATQIEVDTEDEENEEVPEAATPLETDAEDEDIMQATSATWQRVLPLHQWRTSNLRPIPLDNIRKVPDAENEYIMQQTATRQRALPLQQWSTSNLEKSRKVDAKNKNW